MRQSRYAVQAMGSHGEFLLYSTSTGAFVQLDEHAQQVWQDAGKAGASGEAEAAAAELSRVGLLTELSAEDELALQQKAFDVQRADTSKLTLSFIPTYVCNFRCPYCYEIGHNKVQGKMDGAMIDAICEFVDWKHAQDQFGSLSVQWYGGDPSLALDVVEELSGRLIAWCESAGVDYDAMMLTNANVIDDAAADLIAQCRISSVFLTIDGPEEVHNKRRVAANGSNSYQQTLKAARLFQDRGIQISANMNADKVNLPLYNDLQRELYAEAGIVLSAGKLNDYGHFFGEAPFCSPDFDLYMHEEFFEAQFKEFEKLPHDAAELRERLRPIERFCSGQSDNYFVIDLLGDVYNCDGWVGDKGYVRFNILDDKSTWKLHEVSFDATRDEKCSACELLPVCLGSCIWERECSGMPCHPFKTTMPDYLRLYRSCFDGDSLATPVGGVTVLAE